MLTQVWWADKNGNKECVIEDCFGVSPLLLIGELKISDKTNGTTNGDYYVVYINKV